MMLFVKGGERKTKEKVEKKERETKLFTVYFVIWNNKEKRKKNVYVCGYISQKKVVLSNF